MEECVKMSMEEVARKCVKENVKENVQQMWHSCIQIHTHLNHLPCIDLQTSYPQYPNSVNEGLEHDLVPFVCFFVCLCA